MVKLKKKKTKIEVETDERNPLELRCFDLMSFIQRFLRPVDHAIQQLGQDFIEEYCIKRMPENRSIE